MASEDQSDSERGNPLLPHGLLFPISSKGSFICIIPDRIIHTTAFVTPVVEHWLEREIAQWIHHDRSIWWPIAPWANALTTELHLTPHNTNRKRKRNVLFNDALSTFYLRLYDIRHMIKGPFVEPETRIRARGPPWRIMQRPITNMSERSTISNWQRQLSHTMLYLWLRITDM